MSDSKLSKTFRYIFVIMTLLCVRADAGFAAVPSVYKDVSYVAGSTLDQQKLDIYTPRKAPVQAQAQPQIRPVLIFVHGGAWNAGDKDVITANKARAYTDLGMVVVSINYRLSPDYTHPAHIKDVAMAVRWINDHIGEYGGDTKNMALVGHSAGAHLVALLGTYPKYMAAQGLSLDMFRAVIPVDTATFDLTHKQEGKLSRVLQRLRDKAFGLEKDVLLDASPLYHVKQGRALKLSPFMLFVTAERDDAVAQTRFLNTALEKKGHVTRMIIIDEGFSHRDMNVAIFESGSAIFKNVHGALQK